MSKPHCYSCGEEIVFDKNKIGSKSGKMIPLNPVTKEPHQCEKDDDVGQVQAEQEENDYGANMAPEPVRKPAAPTTTLKRHSKVGVKILTHHDITVLEGLYAQFANHMREHGANIQGVPCKVTVTPQMTQYTMFVFYDVPNGNAVVGGEANQQS